MFSFITANWRSEPLTSIRTIVELISATTTKTGLTIQAAYDPAWYPTGVKITDAELAALPLTRHDRHGDWNYTLAPESPHDLATNFAASPDRRGRCDCRRGCGAGRPRVPPKDPS